jgi:hypothetical protein
MCNRHILAVLLGIFAGSTAIAQEQAEEKPSPCHVQPVFHCTQRLDDGSAIGHFGYNYSCSDGSEPQLELYVDIGEQNLFAPGEIDRGQSRVFWVGKNVDVFEIELSPEEVEKGKDLVWTVLDRTARVSYTKTKDGSLDCSKLP